VAARPQLFKPDIFFLPNQKQPGRQQDNWYCYRQAQENQGYIYRSFKIPLVHAGLLEYYQN
jgi:hypothetical protein